jgi:hypothetical protein
MRATIVFTAISVAGLMLISGLNAASAENPSAQKNVAPTQGKAADLITGESAGPVRIGMTVAEARMLAQTSRRAKPASVAHRVRAGTLCHGNERVLFSATVTGSNKLVSICRSSRLDESRGHLQYRFGRPGKIELEFPKSREDTPSQFRYARYTRPLVTYLALRFETGGYLERVA